MGSLTPSLQKKEANWSVKKPENQVLQAANTPDIGAPAVGKSTPSARRQRVYASGTSDCIGFNELHEAFMKRQEERRRQFLEMKDTQKDTQ
jgi:hypothetical protein